MTKKKQSGFARFIKNYRVSVFDNDSLTEKRSFKLSKFKLWFFAVLYFIVVASVVSVAFFYTPLKNVIPGYPTLEVRNKIINNAIMVDSLFAEIEMRDKYLQKIQTVISGGVIEDDDRKATQFSDVDLKPMDSDSIFENLIVPDKYKFSNISLNIGMVDEPFINFISPVSGVIVNRFDASPWHFGTDIVASENSPILAIYDGTVVFAEWSVSTGYVVQIQHDYNMISIYKHNSDIMVRTGDKVKAGDLIAIMGGEGEYSTGPHLHFELWQNGVPLNAEQFINFQSESL
jgi:hypothetical protein